MSRPSSRAFKWTPTKQVIYQHLLADEHGQWSVSTLHAATRTHATSASSIREILYGLLADGVVETVLGHRAMTFRLSSTGPSTLRHILQTWQSHPPHDRR